ncbi:hypothetical protein DPEC_G00019970 [Dallia pectoralis]|uniref:Uncharacterized protein n=1 Tax=Dallia pectoralis TaxID=75939 RepID=A0ACC2HH97_DALPE|nr:hypothetical protein DPEC_G00019970 [Dallia pectoralis]
MISQSWRAVGVLFQLSCCCPGLCMSRWKLGLSDPTDHGAVETAGPPCPKCTPPRAKGHGWRPGMPPPAAIAMTPATMALGEQSFYGKSSFLEGGCSAFESCLRSDSSPGAGMIDEGEGKAERWQHKAP